MAYMQGILALCPCSGGGGFSIRQIVALLIVAGLWGLVLWGWSIWKQRGVAAMKGSIGKIAVVVILAGAVGFVVVAKRNTGSDSAAEVAAATTTSPAEPTTTTQAATPTNIPRLVDLGSKSCIPCKMMAPILDELRTEQAGKMDVVFIDVWEDRQAGREYGINLIPTQIFFDGSGKEVFRHEGFMGKEDILAKCRELGFELAETGSDARPIAAETSNG